MNARPVAILLLALLLPLTLRPVAALDPGDAIIVNNADVVLQPAVAANAQLSSALNSVAPRVVVEFSNVVKRLGLSPLPSGLQTLLNQVAPRVVVQYANHIQRFPLAFSKDLMCDAVPPQITNLQVTRVASTTATVTWTTSKFADRLVRYGRQSGQYPYTVHDPLYYRSHSVALSGLTPKTTYYLRVRGTDQCGNVANSSQLTFKTANPTVRAYLPVVRRQR